MPITGEHAGQEVRRLDDLAIGKETDSLQVTLLRGIVKGVAVAVKILVSIRRNQVTDLVKKYGKGILGTPRRVATDEKPADADKE